MSRIAIMGPNGWVKEFDINEELRNALFNTEGYGYVTLFDLDNRRIAGYAEVPIEGNMDEYWSHIKARGNE